MSENISKLEALNAQRAKLTLRVMALDRLPASNDRLKLCIVELSGVEKELLRTFRDLTQEELEMLAKGEE